ncbi:killer cell lectin-like receptor subfamily F member 1 isoform X2 [Rhinatrema bivittatum]|uniref:killer cell lectin-like receptor subfamily F member 1 isoform X2 n=1 Tax=Rhinatrema bivittatum TaxID=194408 RepID=UPI0011283BD7|nr:killer cell lectin-like receptor subfamily F member 1 isoform X2 [Rhinatrema bivittatum]
MTLPLVAEDECGEKRTGPTTAMNIPRKYNQISAQDDDLTTEPRGKADFICRRISVPVIALVLAALGFIIVIIVLAVFTAPLCPCPPGNGSMAQPCPMNWLRHKGKCYYFSRDTKRSWSRSREDCAERDSELLVIQDQEEKDFINQKTQSEHHWIGLHNPSSASSWTWVDGSSLNGKLFSIPTPTAQEQCVAVYMHSFDPDSCSNVYKWICQKAAGKV